MSKLKKKEPRTLSEVLEIKDFEISPCNVDFLYYRENKKGYVELNTERKPYVRNEIPAIFNNRLVARLVFNDGREIENIPLAYFKGYPLALSQKGKYQLMWRRKVDITGLKQVEITIRRNAHECRLDED